MVYKSAVVLELQRTLSSVALCSGNAPEATIVISASDDILDCFLLASVSQVVQTAEKGEGIDSTVAEPCIDFTKRVACKDSGGLLER